MSGSRWRAISSVRWLSIGGDALHARRQARQRRQVADACAGGRGSSASGPPSSCGRGSQPAGRARRGRCARCGSAAAPAPRCCGWRSRAAARGSAAAWSRAGGRARGRAARMRSITSADVGLCRAAGCAGRAGGAAAAPQASTSRSAAARCARRLAGSIAIAALVERARRRGRRGAWHRRGATPSAITLRLAALVDQHVVQLQVEVRDAGVVARTRGRAGRSRSTARRRRPAGCGCCASHSVERHAGAAVDRDDTASARARRTRRPCAMLGWSSRAARAPSRSQLPSARRRPAAARAAASASSRRRCALSIASQTIVSSLLPSSRRSCEAAERARGVGERRTGSSGASGRHRERRRSCLIGA